MIATFIRSQRAKLGLTQAQIASDLGVARPTYIQIERGERDITIPEAEKLASIFGLSLGDFLGEITPKEAPGVVLEQDENPKKQSIVQIRVPCKNLRKFKQVLLYILEKVGSKPNVGETVLHKLLYFIDFDYYEKFEESLMGATYIKNHHGPTARELGSILTSMQQRGEIEAVKSTYFKYEQKKYLPRKHADLSLFSARELEHIDGVLARLSDKTANEIKRYSHDDIPWRSAEHGKPLSYESVFYRDEQYSVRHYDDEI